MHAMFDDPAPNPGDADAARLRGAIERKRAEIDAAKLAKPFGELEAEVAQAEPPRNLFRAVTRHGTPHHTAVIAELTRRSSDGGFLSPRLADPGYDPAPLAAALVRAGAVAISVPTDEPGSLAHIERVKAAVRVPVLRRDLILDPWQLWESRAAGADAVVIPAGLLPEAQILDMLILTQQLRLTALLEVREMEDLLRVRPHVGFPHPTYFLLGIHNGPHGVPAENVGTTLRLIDLVDDPGVLVSSDGIATPADLARLRAVGVRAVIVGHPVMAAPDPARALAALLAPSDR